MQIVNLRELGGHKGKDGATVKKNLLYRSGNLNFSTEVLNDNLSPLNISVVFDLRSNNEVNTQPYTLPKGINYRHRPIVASMENNAKALNLQFVDNKDELLFQDDFLPKIYKEMGNNPKAFGDIMKEIIEVRGKPVLFHCSAGKDRTGVLAAMLHLALGVSIEDVKENYLLSNDYRRDEAEKDLQKIALGIDNPELLKKIKDMLLVKEEYIDITLDIINSYPTFDEYAESKLGLSPGDLEALRQIYLE